MPFHLFLLRHAEAEPQHEGQSDFDRELLPKGFQQIRNLISQLREMGFQADAIISSPARRAETTSTLIVDALGLANQIEFDSLIYTCEAEELLRIIQSRDDHIQKLLVVGHNPTLSNLAGHLVKGLMEGLKTCDLIEIEFSSEHWKDLIKASGKVIRVIHGSVK
jgi:phosphohistidine phosphatase